jgi:signal peptidase I
MAGSGPLARRGRHARRATSGPGRFAREVVIACAIAILVAIIIRVLLFQAFFVPSASMENTLQVGDRIIASRISTSIGGVHRGDVVVFQDPGGWLPEPPAEPTGVVGWIRGALMTVGLVASDSGQELVKRVIAVSGDRIQCCDVQGRIIVNGVALDEPYIIGPTDQVHFDVTVGPDAMFVMGDNRANSRDSRYHLDRDLGTVPVSNVVGRVMAILWPLTRIASVPVPEMFGRLPG